MVGVRTIEKEGVQEVKSCILFKALEKHGIGCWHYIIPAHMW